MHNVFLFMKIMVFSSVSSALTAALRSGRTADMQSSNYRLPNPQSPLSSTGFSANPRNIFAVKHRVFHLSAIQLYLVLRLCLPFAEFVLFSTDLNTGNQCKNGYNKRQYIQYHAVYSPHFRIAAK